MPVVGYDIYINGVWRTFRDQESVAYDAAFFHKSRFPMDEVQIKRPDGSMVTMRADGRTDR